MLRQVLGWAAAGVLYLVMLPTVHAQTVWSGFDFSFTKGDFTDPTQPENQDRITDNVWITRAVNRGIFNAKTETEYFANSPADTEWATNLNNPTDMIEATNWAALEFAPWIDAYGGAGSGGLPAILTSRDAVVHLIADDIYLDLRFTSYTQQGPGGFAYDRALPPAAPETTGDYNQDGFVNAADYVLWRKTFNLPADPEGSGADGDADGTIDTDDYDFWVEQFGEDVLGGGGTSSAVPEPGGVALTLCALLLRIFFRRRTV